MTSSPVFCFLPALFICWLLPYFLCSVILNLSSFMHQTVRAMRCRSHLFFVFYSLWFCWWIFRPIQHHEMVLGQNESDHIDWLVSVVNSVSSTLMWCWLFFPPSMLARQWDPTNGFCSHHWFLKSVWLTGILNTAEFPLKMFSYFLCLY